MTIRVDAPFKLSSDDLETLVVLYQPLFSFPALAYYMTLYGLAQHDALVEERDLLRRLHCKADTLVLWRQELEQLGLVRSFEHAHLEMVLNKPLSPQEFLSHHIYSRLFAATCSQEMFSLMKERYRQNYTIDITKEISKSFDMRRLTSWSAVEEEDYAKAQMARVANYEFDALDFFKGFSIFPANLVSEDVMKMVGEFGSFYQMSYVDMKSVLMDTIKYDKSVLDTYRFEKLMLEKYGKTSVKEVDNPMELDPMSYLVYRQGHDYVSAAERSAIMSIEKDYGYGNDIANVVIDFILKGKNKQINKGYIDFLVQPMKRKGVESLEQAKAHLNETETQFTNRKNKVVSEVTMPKYSKVSEDDPEELEALRKQLLKGGN